MFRTNIPKSKFLPVRRSKLPDWNETPADTKKKRRQNLNIQQRRPLTPRKFPARCLCLSNKIR